MGKEDSIHAIYTWYYFVRMKRQGHFADLPAISTKDAQQQDDSTRGEGSGGDDGQSVCTCLSGYTRVNKPAVECGHSAACS